jgi:hypothetical protein
MAKATIWGNWDPEKEKRNIAIMCPGCNCKHIIATKEPQSNGAVWAFNGDMDKPTFSPSLLIRTGSHATPEYVDPPECPPTTCHSFITDGKIQFLGDCTHALKGQTVDLPDISEE